MRKGARNRILVSVLVPVTVASLSIATPSAASLNRTPAQSASEKADWWGDAARTEAAFVADINSLRTNRGLPVLEVRAGLVRKARSWAATMARGKRIWHSKLSFGITNDWRKLGENVGMGGSEPTLHAAFVASPRHFENLIDPAFRYVGVGVVHAGGVVFVSQVFMQLQPRGGRSVIPIRRLPPPQPGATPKHATPAFQVAKPLLLFRLTL
jgi:uncharacterized protein YkwD